MKRADEPDTGTLNIHSYAVGKRALKLEFFLLLALANGAKTLEEEATGDLRSNQALINEKLLNFELNNDKENVESGSLAISVLNNVSRSTLIDAFFKEFSLH